MELGCQYMELGPMRELLQRQGTEAEHSREGLECASTPESDRNVDLDTRWQLLFGSARSDPLWVELVDTEIKLAERFLHLERETSEIKQQILHLKRENSETTAKLDKILNAFSAYQFANIKDREIRSHVCGFDSSKAPYSIRSYGQLRQFLSLAKRYPSLVKDLDLGTDLKPMSDAGRSYINDILGCCHGTSVVVAFLALPDQAQAAVHERAEHLHSTNPYLQDWLSHAKENGNDFAHPKNTSVDEHISWLRLQDSDDDIDVLLECFQGLRDLTL